MLGLLLLVPKYGLKEKPYSIIIFGMCYMIKTFYSVNTYIIFFCLMWKR